MTNLEIFSIIILLYGVISGWRNGFIKEVLSTVGFLIGLYVAYYCYTHLGLGAGWALLLCLFFPFGLGFATSMVAKMLDHVFAIGKLNRILGAVVGFIKCGILVLCITKAAETIEEWKNLLL